MFIQKISATGFLVAWLRSLYAELGSFAHDIARITRAQENFPLLIKQAILQKYGAGKISEDFLQAECERYLNLLKPVAPFVEIRDACALELIRREWKMGLVIEVATGLSPVSFEIAASMGIRCIATDRDLTNALKEVAETIFEMKI